MKQLLSGIFYAFSLSAFAEAPAYVEWNFNDEKAPFASSGTKGMDLTKGWGGKPVYIDGVVGKAIQFNEDSKFFLAAPQTVNTTFTDGHKSFTAECFVKMDGMNYALFIGNRSAATWYGSRGWALGSLNTGNLTAVIGDGDKRTATDVNHLRSSWEPGEWNHLAIVRDAEKNKVILYLNGTPTGWQICRSANTEPDSHTPIDTTTPGPIRLGLDGMTGGLLVGALDEVRITAGVLSPEQIAARAKLITSARGNGQKSLALAKTPVTVADAALPQPTELTLLPQPRTYEASSEVVKIASPTWRAEGDKLEIFDEEAFNQRLGYSCGMTMTNAAAGVVLNFELAKMEHSEGFEVRGGVAADGAYEISVRAETFAKFYYGVDIAAQILRKTSLANGKVLSAPKTFALTDWPSMPHRMSLPPLDYELRCADRHFDVVGRDIAFMRMNGMHFQIQKAPEARLKALCDKFRHYDIGVMPWWSYQGTKKPTTPLSETDMAEMKAYFDKGGRAGVKGYTIAFDDLSGPFVEIAKQPEVKAAYGTEGGLHNAIVKKAVEFSKPYAPKFFQVIPFTYCANEDGGAKNVYFKDFCKDFDTLDVTTLHTVFTQRAVDELHESGVKKFGYYVNGTWPTPLFFKWYMGPECIPWTWNMFYIDRNGVGPVPYLDMLEEVKHIHERGAVLFGAASSHRARFIAGWFSWNPAAWDYEHSAKSLTQRFYGSGVHEPLTWYSKLVAPMVGAFMSYKTSWTNESKAPETKRLAPMSKSEILGYFRNLKKAEQAADLVEQTIKNQANMSVFDRPEFRAGEAKENQTKLVKDLRSSLKEIHEKLMKLAVKYGIDEMYQ